MGTASYKPVWKNPARWSPSPRRFPSTAAGSAAQRNCRPCWLQDHRSDEVFFHSSRKIRLMRSWCIRPLPKGILLLPDHTDTLSHRRCRSSDCSGRCCPERSRSPHRRSLQSWLCQYRKPGPGVPLNRLNLHLTGLSRYNIRLTYHTFPLWLRPSPLRSRSLKRLSRTVHPARHWSGTPSV